jgi:hypothetical protein
VARRWDFLLAGVSFPIIGIDFLRHHGLLVDVANLRLLPGAPPPAVVCAVTGASGPAPSRIYAEVVRGGPPPSGGLRVAAKGRAEVKVPSGSSAHTFAASCLQAAAVAVPAPSPPSLGSSPPSLVGFPAAAVASPPLTDWAASLRAVFRWCSRPPRRPPRRHPPTGFSTSSLLLANRAPPPPPPRPSQAGSSQGGVSGHAG